VVLLQLELTVLRIESRLKDSPSRGDELDVDNMSFMVDVDEMDDNSSANHAAKRHQQ
jgi:hypothetical protein